ncbi:MAG: 7-cyano-7-deazaguanine synthase QueC [Thermoplasmata archaeon]|nr:MAG: 7-cyano-7-deazaguanine synthase QueC [Thermoplasmata archaeon]
MKHKAICLISGGIDSCVATFIALEKGYQIYALSFNYGQLHDRELDSAKKIAEAAETKRHIIFDINLQLFGGSSLLDRSLVMPKNREMKDISSEGIPSTYVPARNTVFLSIALAYAESIDADAIFIGANAIDYSGYPDCRPEYIRAYQSMADLATRRGVEGRPIRIEAPLLYMTKADIIKSGIRLGAPLEKTWSCYKGGEKACGRCDSCIIRLKGFKEAGVDDPIKYEYYPDWYKK